MAFRVCQYIFDEETGGKIGCPNAERCHRDEREQGNRKVQLVLQEENGDSSEKSSFFHTARADFAIFLWISVSAFRTAVFVGVVCGIQREITVTPDDIQIFFEQNHRCAAEVGHRGDEDRLSARADCGEA